MMLLSLWWTNDLRENTLIQHEQRVFFLKEDNREVKYLVIGANNDLKDH